MKRFFVSFLVALGLLASSFAQSTTAADPTVADPAHADPTVADQIFVVAPKANWLDTKADLHPGDHLQITAVSAEAAGASACSPDGVSQPAADTATLPLPSALPGALLARFQEHAIPVLVGSSQEFNVTTAGRLYLGPNTRGFLQCTGGFNVTVHLGPKTQTWGAEYKGKLSRAANIWLNGQGGDSSSTAPTSPGIISGPGAAPVAPTKPAQPLTAPAKLELSTSALDSALTQQIERLPRRVSDEFHGPGDAVNFVLIGSEQQMKDALTAAGWHLADKSVESAIMRAIIETSQKKDYLAMPISLLYLFGRSQDFGYEQAEAVAMVASRHHFRLWKAPFQWQGRDVWAGAGTHDIGFERDQRNGSLTHKIDPKVDGERDHIAESLQQAGQVKSLNYFLPSNPVLEARNATGGGYTSSGQILVIVLK